MTSDVFGEFESFSEILGYVFHAQGPEALLELLKIAALDADTLHQAAKEMSAAGMDEAAELVAGAAARAAPTRASVEIAKIREMDDEVWRKARLAELYRRGQIILADMAGFPAETIDFAARSRPPRKGQR
jgi:hypothetical protein